MALNPQQQEIARQVLNADANRLPPHNVQAEEALLGSLLILPDDMPTIAGLVAPGDFYIVRNQLVFEALLDLWHAGTQIDYLTTADRLRESGRLDEIDGASYLAYLVNAAGGSAYLTASYAGIVQREADRRRLLAAASEAARLAWQDDANPAAAWGAAVEAVMSSKPRVLDQHLMLGSDISDRFLQLQSSGEIDTKIFPLPFNGGSNTPGLPYMTGGKLFGIGGNEKSGKSSLAEQLSEHWARLGMRGFYIHTEEKADAKILRRFARWAAIDYLRLEVGKLTPAEIERREHALVYVAPWEARLNYWYESLPTTTSILTLVKRAVSVFQADYIVLDNFTDIAFADRDNVARQALELLQRLDDFAVQNNVLIVITTQMSTRPDGQRIAYGTSSFAKKCSWFWDINRKRLDQPVKYSFEGQEYTFGEGEFDPRCDIAVPASRYGRGALIPLFALLPRFMWVDRDAVDAVTTPPVINYRTREPRADE